MASGSSGLLDFWLVKLLQSAFFPESPYLTVRIISGVFAALGIAFVFPIISLVVFDVCLWIWRLYSVNRNAYLQRQQQEQHQQQLLREQRRVLRKQQEQEQQEQHRSKTSTGKPPATSNS
ncbi:uncharacterized protein SPSK_03689 [Sporothrix schenckii 1099-18]|uniref:Uncharacterized protein n=1 Tax=Sporothrix schenckii 1099-18 TaxID=1397361 RepID=A0A0F2M375_SPOSC|nr:uncharacterized protein SPSK_03689 [Sporothrix schenckii 1099-18]KJR82591.1 hypothetical protein SPSK_03689 [Sporothrix schenckii 1099-18]